MACVVPFNGFTLMTFLPSCKIWSLLPLHNTNAWSIFLINITGTRTFETNLWWGIPEHLIEFRNSMSYKSFQNYHLHLWEMFVEINVRRIIYDNIEQKQWPHTAQDMLSLYWRSFCMIVHSFSAYTRRKKWGAWTMK